jgi:hypothetical protein
VAGSLKTVPERAMFEAAKLFETDGTIENPGS